MQQIYLMRNALGLHKVGISSDPKRRARELANASGVPVTLIKAWRCEDARVAERKVHTHFKTKRKSGEWFDFGDTPLEDVFSCVESCGGVDDIPPPPIRIKHITCTPERFKPPCWRNLCRLEREVQGVPQTLTGIKARLELQCVLLRNLVLESKLDLGALAQKLSEKGYHLPHQWRQPYSYEKQGVYELDSQANCLQRAIPIHKELRQGLQYRKVYTVEWLKMLQADIDLHSNTLVELDAQIRQTYPQPQLRLVA